MTPDLALCIINHLLEYIGFYVHHRLLRAIGLRHTAIQALGYLDRTFTFDLRVGWGYVVLVERSGRFEIPYSVGRVRVFEIRSG